MTTSWIIIGVVILLLVAAVVVLAVLWRREYHKRWQETSLNLNLQKECTDALNEYQARIDEANRDVCASNASKDALYAELAVTAEERDMFFKERNELQHKLSAHLCPRNDHVWGDDGKCKRCGAIHGA